MKKLLLIVLLIITSYSLSAQVVNPTVIHFDCTEISESVELVETKLNLGSSNINTWRYPYVLPAGGYHRSIYHYFPDTSYGSYELIFTFKYKGNLGTSSLRVPKDYVGGMWLFPWYIEMKFRNSTSPYTGVYLTHNFIYQAP